MDSIIDRSKQGITCETCGKNFTSAKNLKDHTKEQHLTDKLQCQVCQRWITPRRYKRHMIEAHSGGQFKCDVCTKMFSCERNLKEHMKYQHQSGKLQCEICLRSFHPHSLRRHMIEVHSMLATTSKRNNRCTCSICGLSLSSLKSLKRHIETIHSSEGRPRKNCEVCGSSVLAEGYRRHLKDVHLKPSNTTEKSCSSPFSKSGERDEYSQDEEQKQDKTLPNQDRDRIRYEICQKSVVPRTIKRQRIEVHSGTSEQGKSVECNTCAKLFANSKNLKEHIKEQHNDEKVQCQICLKWLPPRRLKEHTSKVHGGLDTQTNCSICGLDLSSQKSLERHIQAMHSDEDRPRVNCELCGKSVLADGYKRHLKKIHPARSTAKSCSSSDFKSDDPDENKPYFPVKDHEKEQNQYETIPIQDFGHIVECEVCNLTFSEPTDLGKHVKEYHSGSRGKLTFSLK